MICDRCPLWLAVAALVLLPACSPAPPYGSYPLARPPARPERPTSPPPEPASRAVVQTRPPALPDAPKPVLRESDIREERLRVDEIVPQPGRLPPAEKSPAREKALLKEATIKVKEGALSRAPAVEEGGAPEEPSLVALITAETPPQGAASLRLAEEGRRLLEAEHYQAGLSKLEKAIALDSGNRYAYFYLARAHYHLSHHQQSLNFLEIIEPGFSGEPLWLARVYALEGENYRRLGLFGRADARYLKALAIDPSSRVALEGLSYFPQESASPAR